MILALILIFSAGYSTKVIKANNSEVHMSVDGEVVLNEENWLTRYLAEKIFGDEERFDELRQVHYDTIEQIYVFDKKFDDIPIQITKLFNLQYLTIHNAGLTTIPSYIGQVSTLVSIDLNDNNITSLPAEVSKLHNVQSIYLERNNLTSLPTNVETIPNLKSLRISENNLTDLPRSLENAHKLEYILANDNNFTTIPEVVSSINSIKGLSVNSNSITELPEFLKNLVNLDYVFASNNNIKSIQPSLTTGDFKISAANQSVDLGSFRHDEEQITIPNSIKYGDTYLTPTDMVGVKPGANPSELVIDVPTNASFSFNHAHLNNTFSGNVTLTTETNNKPEIFANDLTLNVGDDFDALLNVSANDIEDGDLTAEIRIVDNNVDMNKAGAYQVTYEVVDSEGATTTKTISVTVNPTLEGVNNIPTITANDLTLNVGDDFDALLNVSANDIEDGDLTAEIRIVDNNVDMNKAGTYQVTYEVVDSEGATTTKTISVTVNPILEDVNSFPVITIEDKTIYVGETFNPLEGLSIKDLEDGDLTDKVVIINNTVDTSKVGIYEVTYQVTDSTGLVTTKTIKVEVKAREVSPPTGDNSNLMFYILLMFTALINCTYLLKSKKR